ncbi:ACS family glucarate transporter-like MFS transporter [Sporomusaceae bacterium BoRhaA]|uniref:MFS transporter n=1 Tax=Pelorhabdus rhamnosifermentans TaxID=2772457 RepID=UPI001C061870|nr:MFS transporter [Pelorhabdus rhamnosifermentans]MBU2702779.1 ACS family glucarate transporter-like MFS transporter [Pelorhabdus rhamnosifermentans]
MEINQQNSRKTNVRYFILAMIFIVTTFNYVDRATLSIAAPIMKNELGFDAITMGLAFSAFGWAYTGMQIPGGWILDRYGARVVYGVGLLFWSIFTFFQGFIGYFSSAFIILFALRFLMGVAESPAFPANSRLTVMWFPTRERGMATAVFQTAQYFALAVFTPLMTWVIHTWSWHYIFFGAGAVGVILALIWLKFIQDPKHHKGVNQAELDYIQAGGGLSNIGDTKTKVKWCHIRTLITNRMILGVYIGQFCLTTITWFFLTWFPTYLVVAKGMTILKAGFVASVPAIAGCAGGMLGGVWSDWLIRRGNSLTVARKTPIITGLLFTSSIVMANYVSSEIFVIAVMSLAFFSKGIGNLGWCVIGDTSPKEIMGISGGIFNLCGNVASIITPLAIGYILARTGSFDGALLYVGIIGFLGAMSYLFIVGDIKRVELTVETDKLDS